MKLNLIFSLAAFYLLLGGCKKAEKPIIDEKKMVDVLVDIHLIEASLLGFPDNQKDSLSPIYYRQIYEIHSISEDSFLTEMNFLKHHPEYMEHIYKLVLEEIDRREAEFK